ncbi:MAG: ATP-dependent Clp protease proteolytic subunit [Candidatus Limnocylindrales bacterium]
MRPRGKEIGAVRSLLPVEEEKLRAEEEKLRAETAVERLKERLYTTSVERAEREAAQARASFEAHHTWYLTDSVNHVSCRVVMDKLHQWDLEDPTCGVEIIVTSPGGDALQGMALFDYIGEMRRKGHHITIHALGYAASMAAILLQAASWRVIGRESWLLVHEVSADSSGKVGEMEDTVKMLEKMCARVADIFVERAEGKIDLETFTDSWGRKDWWMDSEEALRLGFVDEVR